MLLLVLLVLLPGEGMTASSRSRRRCEMMVLLLVLLLGEGITTASCRSRRTWEMMMVLLLLVLLGERQVVVSPIHNSFLSIPPNTLETRARWANRVWHIGRLFFYRCPSSSSRPIPRNQDEQLPYSADVGDAGGAGDAGAGDAARGGDQQPFLPCCCPSSRYRQKPCNPGRVAHVWSSTGIFLSSPSLSLHPLSFLSSSSPSVASPRLSIHSGIRTPCVSPYLVQYLGTSACDLNFVRQDCCIVLLSRLNTVHAVVEERDGGGTLLEISMLMCGNTV